METISEWIQMLMESNLVRALVVLVLGCLVAVGARKACTELLAKIKLDERFARKAGEPLKVEAVITNLVYYVLLLYVLLLTLDVLGLENVLEPLKTMFNQFLSMFPNIVGALLIAFVGYLAARMISTAVAVMAKGLDKVAVKAGLGEKVSLSGLLGKIVFVLVFVPILVSALDTLKIEAISAPAVEMLGTLTAAIPKILAAALILVVAYMVGRFVANILAGILHDLGVDDLLAKIGVPGVLGEQLTLSKFCAGLTFFFIMLGAVVSAVEKLDMPTLSDLLGQFLVFAGQLALGLVILLAGNLLAQVAHRALSQSEGQEMTAAIARIAILGLVLAMGLRAMGIANEIVNLAFGLTVGSVAVTVALAFGLGGREAAGKQMEYWLSKMRKEE